MFLISFLLTFELDILRFFNSHSFYISYFSVGYYFSLLGSFLEDPPVNHSNVMLVSSLKITATTTS